MGAELKRIRRERGAVLVFVTIGLLAFLALTALATDSGKVWVARDQVRGATDSAALAGAAVLSTNGVAGADPAAAIAEAQVFGPQNEALATPINIATADIQTGSWDVDTRTFTSIPGGTGNEVRAVRVLGRRDATLNSPIPTVFGRAVGVDNVPVSTLAIAYRDWAAILPPRSLELPIVLDCCSVSNSTGPLGDTCKENACEHIQSGGPFGGPEGSGCELDPDRDPAAHAALGTVSCAVLNPSNDQEVCWSEFSTSSPGVSASDLKDLVENGNIDPVGAEPVYIDNGTTASVIREARWKFEGSHGYPSRPGSDLYPPGGNGEPDSWVVVIPLVECQNPGPGCAGGSAQMLVGLICMDIHEINEGGSPKYIKFSVLCPSDSRCDFSGLGPGGIPGTLLAEPVLVQ